MKKTGITIVLTALLTGCTSPAVSSAPASSSTSASSTAETVSSFIAPADFSDETKEAISIFGNDLHYYGWKTDKTIHGYVVHKHVLENSAWTEELLFCDQIDEEKASSVISLFIYGGKLKADLMNDTGHYFAVTFDINQPEAVTILPHWLEEKTAIVPDQQIVLCKVVTSSRQESVISEYPLQDTEHIPVGAEWGYAVSITFTNGIPNSEDESVLTRIGA